jgi:hypothetical protein
MTDRAGTRTKQCASTKMDEGEQGKSVFLHCEGVKVMLWCISHLRSSLDHTNTPLVCNSIPI